MLSRQRLRVVADVPLRGVVLPPLGGSPPACCDAVARSGMTALRCARSGTVELFTMRPCSIRRGLCGAALLTIVTAGSSIPIAPLMAFGTAAADLIIDTVAAPSDVSPGAVFDATDVIRNAGTADSRSSVTRYYFSRDAVKSSGDVRSTGSRSVSTLTVGSESHGVVKLAGPFHSGTGNLHIVRVRR